jgi:DNA-binding GntR family transcriptional regulator
MHQKLQPSPPSLGPLQAPSLADQTSFAIVEGIASGVLKPGQRLVETELAQLFQVSRVPLREALKVLEAQGIVESTRHRGTHVTQFDETRFDQICEARVALERIAITGAAEACRKDPALLKRFETHIEAIERAAQSVDWPRIGRADIAFHREFCLAADNPVVLTLWEAIARNVMIVFGHEARHERDAAAIGPDHRRLLAMLTTARMPELHDAIEKHIMRLRFRSRATRA